MSAKFPRRSFAAPLVVTLAVPACFVTSGKPAPAPTTGGTSDGSVRDNRTGERPGHVNPPPVVGTAGQPHGQPEPGPGTTPISNPPPPDRATQPAPTTPTKPPHTMPPGGGAGTVQQPPQPTQQTPQTTPLRSWTVFVNNDKSCSTQYDVVCPPKGATCNPPPPQKLAKCPSGITMDRPLKIKEDAANSCALYYPNPECPAGVACNPPRPQTIACPTR